ncbi:MAG: hypothetical protein M1153_00075 [Patescibacteria group bacterium]|nr:hypothetical protein [Patescibacteria group bacterium]
MTSEWKLMEEMSAAAFRVAGLVREPSLKKELVSAAVEIVSRVSSEDEALPNLSSLEKLARIVSLGMAIGEISETNASVLKREIDGIKGRLKMAVSSPQSLILSLPVEVGGVLEIEGGKGVSGKFGNGSGNGVETDFQKLETEEVIAGNQENSVLDPSERQEEIVEYMKGFPDGCRTKDVYVRFPEVSDRTLRNDIRHLLGNGRLEKVDDDAGQRIRLSGNAAPVSITAFN